MRTLAGFTALFLPLSLLTAVQGFAASKPAKWECNPSSARVMVLVRVSLSSDLKTGRIELEDRGGFPPIQILEAPLKPLAQGQRYSFHATEWNRNGTLTALSTVAPGQPFEAEIQESTLKLRFSASCKPVR